MTPGANSKAVWVLQREPPFGVGLRHGLHFGPSRAHSYDVWIPPVLVNGHLVDGAPPVRKTTCWTDFARRHPYTASMTIPHDPYRNHRGNRPGNRVVHHVPRCVGAM